MTRPPRSISALFASLLFALFTSLIAWGQATAVSQISGVVQDATGAAVPGAQVRVSQTETSMTRTATASTDGSYTIPNLPVGPYRLEASAPGFSTFVQTGIVLQVNTNPVINPALQIGAVTETVSVTADAAMAETHTNAISQVIDQTRIVELPLNGRNPTQLILLSGAAAAPPTGGDLNTSKDYQTQSSIISIAGGQISGTNPARYGLHPGGVVNLVTKSGSNQFQETCSSFFETEFSTHAISSHHGATHSSATSLAAR